MQLSGCGKGQCFVFGRERRALALRKIQQIQGALEGAEKVVVLKGRGW
jgi:hypothetical protein